MEEKSPKKNKELNSFQQSIVGLIFFGAGLAIVLLSIGTIPGYEESGNAPRWVVGLAGGLFSAAGIMIANNNRIKWLGNLLFLYLIAAFGAIFGWVAFFGDAEGFSLNGQSGLNGLGVFIARFMFGGFAVLCGLLILGTLISPIIKFFKKKR